MPKLRIFTNEEKLLIDQMYNNGHRYSDIYSALGCKDKPLRRYLNENGYSIRGKGNLLSSDGLRKSRKHYFNEQYFSIIDTEDKAYWLGFWFADGNVCYKKGKNGNTKGGVAELSLKSSDKGHLIKMLEYMNADKDYPIYDKNIKLNGKTYTACRVELNSIDTCRDLEKHGCVPAKSLILQPPKDVPKHLIRHFIRGYFDGDGSISFNEKTKDGGASLMGTEDVLNYIKEQSDLSESKLAEDKRGCKALTLFICSVSNTFIFYNYIYNDATIFLDRKKEKFDKYVEYLKQEYPQIYKNSLSSDSLVKHKLHGISVAIIDKDYNYVDYFKSFRETSVYAKVNESVISNLINGKTKKKFIDNYYYIKYEDYYYNKNNLKEYMLSKGYIGL